MTLFWLSDAAWAAIEPHLPQNQPGGRRLDDRRVISGILHVLKTGCRWCDGPSEYGPSTTVYNRFNRFGPAGASGFGCWIGWPLPVRTPAAPPSTAPT